jgi:hypothetical protein
VEALINRSFENINCTTKPGKQINNYPTMIRHYLWDPEDLQDTWMWITIPPRGQVWTIKLEVPRNLIEAADVEKGEKYVVKIGHRCLGTRWWTYGTLEELDGVRLRQWYQKSEKEEEERLNPSLKRARDRDAQEIIDKFGDGPTSIGEEPRMLAMVRENDGAEFEIV